MAVSSAAKKFMENFDSAKVLKSLCKIAELPQQERRAAIADPVPYFSRVGLNPPAGVTVKISERPFDRAEVPSDVVPPVAFQRPILVCFWVTIWIITASGTTSISRLVCVLVDDGRGSVLPTTSTL